MLTSLQLEYNSNLQNVFWCCFPSVSSSSQPNSLKEFWTFNVSIPSALNSSTNFPSCYYFSPLQKPALANTAWLLNLIDTSSPYFPSLLKSICHFWPNHLCLSQHCIVFLPISLYAECSSFVIFQMLVFLFCLWSSPKEISQGNVYFYGFSPHLHADDSQQLFPTSLPFLSFIFLVVSGQFHLTLKWSLGK